MTCPGSVDLIATLDHGDAGRFADEGSCAHALGELKVLHHFGHISDLEYEVRYDLWLDEWEQFTKDPEWLVDVNRHMDDYVECVVREARRFPASAVLVEQRLFTGVEGVWGTSDVVIMSPTNITVVDLKYGAGVRVDAEGNKQARLYAAGALNELGNLLGDTETVRYVIFQPRIGNGHVSFEDTTVDELKSWIDEVVIPAAAEALSGSARFNPSEKGCRWCPASGRCRAQMEEAFREPFADPPGLSPADMAEALQRAPMVRAWLSALEAAALNMAYTEGKSIPGWRVVRSGGIRKIQDPDAAIDALAMVGWDKDTIAPRKILGIGALEKLLGKNDFGTVLNEFIGKTEGRPSLAPADDSRPSIDRNADAGEIFGAYNEGNELL
jgi:hypothetical protein